MFTNMSVNSSSFADLPSNSSFNPFPKCFSSITSIYIFSAFSITYILPLPLFIRVLYLGYQHKRKQHSGSTATSHSDFFTYHTVVMQLTEFLGLVLFLCGGFMNRLFLMAVGLNGLSSASFGLAMFHILTCVERYLAVLHPTTYLGLRQAAGVRIRNISIGCVWLFSFGVLFVNLLSSEELKSILFYCTLVFFLLVISFCSIVVLCTLKRPGPGEVGGNRERVDQSKQRAFYTIMAILAVLLLRFGGNLIINVIFTSTKSTADICMLVMFIIWLDLPSTLVLPLLFLHRAGKLPCCKL